MNCPYCNEEMVKGYIDQTRIGFPLEWYSGKRKPGLIFDKFEKIKLTSSLKGGRVIVYHCAPCRKFVIDQDEVVV